MLELYDDNTHDRVLVRATGERRTGCSQAGNLPIVLELYDNTHNRVLVRQVQATLPIVSELYDDKYPQQSSSQRYRRD